MRWLALLLVAGCGRIAFDPLGGGGDGDGGMTSGDGMTATDDGGGDAMMATCMSTYRSGGNGLVNGTTMTATLGIGASTMANTLIVVQIGWAANTGAVNSVTDTNGNTYTAATPTTRSGTQSQVMYIAPYQIGAAGTLTITFAAPVPNPITTYATYGNVNLASPLEGVASVGQGNSDSPTVSRDINGPAMLVAGVTSNTSGGTAGSGFQKRSGLNGNFTLDRCAATAGSYVATATLTASGNWILHLIVARTL